MKAILCIGYILYTVICSAQNVGIGTPTPLHKLDVTGNIALNSKLAVSDLLDGWLRLNPANAYTNGVYSPGALRIEGGIVSGTVGTLGAGTIHAMGQVRAPIYYDYDNPGYYMDPASTSNINNLRFNFADCINGFCPPNNAIRFTPNFHVNATNGNAFIINWDNGSTPGAHVKQLRVGTGQGADAFFVTSGGNVVTSGLISCDGIFSEDDIISLGTILAYGKVIVDNSHSNTGSSTSFALEFGNSSGEGIGCKRNAGGNQHGLDFYTNSISRLSITNAGYTGINRMPTTGSSAGAFQVQAVSGGDDIFGIYNSAGTNRWTYYTSNDDLVLYNNGFFRGFWSSVNGVYTSSSDKRLKKDITLMPPVLSSLVKIPAYLFRYNDNLPTDPLTVGFMAQDLQTYFPEAIKTIINKDGTTNLGIQYQYLSVYAIKAIQEQQEQIDQLKKQNEILLSRLDIIEKDLKQRRL